MSNRKVRRLVHHNLDDIETTARRIAGNWNTKSVPLKTMRTIIDKSKIKGKTKIEKFKNVYNELLEQLYTTCETAAKEMESESIALHMIQLFINQIKEGFDKGLG